MYVMTLNYLRTVYSLYIYSCVANKVRQKKTLCFRLHCLPKQGTCRWEIFIFLFFYSGVTWPPALQIMVGKEFFCNFTLKKKTLKLH